MSPHRFSGPLVRKSPVLTAQTPVREAIQLLLDTGLPALPVTRDGRFCGIFGEREFFAAVFPGYLGELKYAGFIGKALEAALDKRASCRHDPVLQYMNREHVDVGPGFSDLQVAETFLHHRVLIIPVVEQGNVLGVITRSDFFRAVGERFLSLE
jgi:CBS domain-containing protein